MDYLKFWAAKFVVDIVIGVVLLVGFIVCALIDTPRRHEPSHAAIRDAIDER